ncbi:MAG TPA: ISL3 family transposase [Myxococcaceae bacterium]|nr:ISL3 family transposase [Myxococcaceae bacterium]
MSQENLVRRVLLPEFKLFRCLWIPGTLTTHVEVEKVSEEEVCPRCATPSRAIYDRRLAVVQDEPLRDKPVRLSIRKRRFSCRPCGKPFTEPVPGIRKGSRSTERYKQSVLWACETFSDLSAVRRAYKCSAGFIYRTLYERLERRLRERQSPWPKVLGIDEHFFRRNPTFGFREFVSVLIDYKGRRMKEVVHGRTAVELEHALRHIPGRNNVQWVVMDMCEPFRNFARSFFPKALIVADKFHVLRLLFPAINRRRKEITGDKRTLPLRRLLLKNGADLSPEMRWRLHRWLDHHPELQQLYHWKEGLAGFYRIRGYAAPPELSRR